MEEIEFKKCAIDFKYFLKYVKVFHPVKGTIDFEYHPFYDRVIAGYEGKKYSIIKKFRQGGFSTLTLVWLIWNGIFKQKRIGYITFSASDARYISDLAKKIIENLPNWLKPILGKNTESVKEFVDSGSIITFKSHRMYVDNQFDILVLDEAAFFNWESFNLENTGKCIVFSTAYGRGTWFEKTYTDALEGKNSFEIIEVSYLEHPLYTPEFIEKIKRDMGLIAFSQEVLASFD